jgi:hypothetical protein
MQACRKEQEEADRCEGFCGFHDFLLGRSCLRRSRLNFYLPRSVWRPSSPNRISIEERNLAQAFAVRTNGVDLNARVGLNLKSDEAVMSWKCTERCTY